ncbi:MAG: tRNA dihydrouridine synthase DusB [Candidatus Marinimicrobia bacterium]|nr:tRNA dihydrouridine synthase DusB [Candidatus Neomarinimicrobiota bacterium]|tara:strand:- start:10351 stop:11343 length:993 start_codon:yes stop_codon:yes gene_type:complete
MKIGSLNIETPVFLAPMAGVTDYPFRILCKEMGAGVVYSEFVSADGIIRENIKTLNMVQFEEKERPIGIQIFGNNAESMGKAAKYISDNFQPDIIDINYGCPVPKITKKGGGSAALKDLCLMNDITASVIEAVPELPVTVKMRAGWNKESIIIPEAGQQLEKIGVKAITLHPRTTKQRYTGKANWDYIRILKESVSIPVIGNGDICNTDDMIRMFDETRCDAVMVARATQGNPWFFQNAKARLAGQQIPLQPSLLDIAEMCKRHFDLMLINRGEKTGFNLMKKHFSNYIKGFPGAAAFRKTLVTSSELPEMRKALDRFTIEARKTDLEFV